MFLYGKWQDFRKGLFTPVLAPFLQKRSIILIMAAMAFLQLYLTGTGLPAWQCPIKSTLGVPCPGCGLSTAMALFVKGKWGDAMLTHAFAPFLFIGSVVILIFSLLPNPWYRHVIQGVGNLEKITGLVPLILASFLVYWLFRLSALL